MKLYEVTIILEKLIDYAWSCGDTEGVVMGFELIDFVQTNWAADTELTSGNLAMLNLPPNLDQMFPEFGELRFA